MGLFFRLFSSLGGRAIIGVLARGFGSRTKVRSPEIMTTRYRVEYALKTHRRDQFIEWIKGLLAVPFVLHTRQPAIPDGSSTVEQVSQTARQRYADIFLDVERLVEDHIKHQETNTAQHSKLKLLVPSIGTFFTPLYLHDAFLYEDAHRHISTRRFVAPSFNDIRIILNTAQVMGMQRQGPLKLVTFDGDVTLYEDGASLHSNNPVIPRIIALMAQGISVGIVTAAGYTDASRYYGRLYGLLDAVEQSDLSSVQKRNLVVMGGEANFLFQFDETVEDKLRAVPREDWALPEMMQWEDKDIECLLDTAQDALQTCVANMRLKVQVLRKERAVGIVPAEGAKLTREQLEETVLVAQRVVESSSAGKRIPFCAFNGGNDVFVDIGDKAWGVLCCQRYLGGIAGASTLHVGDQFLSAGANDFKARLACTTAWIANPEETVKLLDQLVEGSL